jgi:DNA-binding helix-hairpin-helix protein with protein kinase domain
LIGQHRLQLLTPIGQGGGGIVYKHPVLRDQCVKILSNPDEIEPERINFMVANPPPQLYSHGLANFAWPLAPAFCEQTGRLVGFSMPYLAKVLPVQAIINPNACGPAITRAWKWKVGIELLRQMQTLHLMSPAHILGDVNLENFMVHRGGRVSIIDLDSTHFVAPSGTVFLCGRHRPEMQPPELVSAKAPIMERGQDQDAFSLAIVIHRLLREGLHPYDAVYCGKGTPLRLHERIEQGIWPDSQRHPEYRPKPGTIPYTALPTDLQVMFRQMFEEGHTDRQQRPDVSQMLTLLELHRPWRVRTASIGRFAWRRELNPTPAPRTTIGNLIELGRRHASKVAMATSVLGGTATYYLFPAEQTPPRSTMASSNHEWSDFEQPKANSQLSPPDPTTGGEAPTESPAPTLQLLEAPSLWRQAEESLTP